MSTFGFIVSVLTLRLFTFSSFVVEGPSMEPTLHSGDIFLTEKVGEEEGYGRGDVVVFSFEDEPDYFYVKRIVGLSGEVVQILSDGIYVNDLRLTESYLTAGTNSVPRSAAYRENFQQTYRVPEGNYFVLGDNREQSLDSRHFPQSFVDHVDVKGRYVSSVLTQDASLSWSTLRASVVIDTQQGPVPFVVQVAETNDQRMEGLMYREALPKGYGMYFIFDEEANRAFWMKNTLIPLDMIFVDAEGVIVHIQEMVSPCKVERCPSYPSLYPAQYVLEIAGGESLKWGIDEGDTVSFIRST